MSDSPEIFSPQRITEATLSIISQPAELYLGKSRLQIVDPTRDLEPEVRRGLNPAIGCFIIDPVILKASEHIGYKALRDDESVVLGRASELGRFKFGNHISREHVMITRNGTEIRVKDLGSLNGTFIGRPLLKQEVEATSTFSGPDHETNFGAGSFFATVSTLASERHPEQNEDSAFADAIKPAVGVFDGVGGLKGSGLASQIAAHSTQKSLEGQPTIMPVNLSMLAVKEALQAAHSEIRRKAYGVATTATIAKLFKTETGQPYAAIASVGDSRAYLYRNGILSFLTLDKAYEISSAPEHVQKLQDTLANVVDVSRLNEDEKMAFRRRNVIDSGLGFDDDPLITATNVMLQPGDKIVVTSDGIHDNLTTEEIGYSMQFVGLTENPDVLVANARARSRAGHLRSKPDDMTAAILTFNG